MNLEGGVWFAIVGWLADRAPPLVAGFFGGVVASWAIDKWRKRQLGKASDDTN